MIFSKKGYQYSALISTSYDNAINNRKSSDGAGEACKVSHHDKGLEASGHKALSPLQIFRKLFTPKSGEHKFA